MVKPIKSLHPSSVQSIRLRARAMISALRARGLTTTRDLGHALAAAKMLVTVLEAQARVSDVPKPVLAKADELASDLEDVVEFLGMDMEDVGGRIH